MSYIVAVIPARGGSKGIPDKNLQTVGGVPLLVRAIRSCQAANQIDLVVVSTDNDQIATMALEAGAKVIRRPAELSTDKSTSEAALLHVLGELEKEGIQPDLLAFVQCTTPFVEPSDIDGTVQLLSSFDSALTVAPSHRFVWKHDESKNGTGVNHSPLQRFRRQELPPEFIETGGVYAMKTAGLVANGHRFFGKIGLHVVPVDRAIEIDDYSDLSIARALAMRPTEFPIPNDNLLIQLRAVVFDFDGVMTDNRVGVSETGREFVLCDRSDGLGISNLHRIGIRMLILSKETNRVVRHRARKLRVEVIHGCDEKAAALAVWLQKNAIDQSDCAYVGNDINDVECMKLVGLAASPRDAHPRAHQNSQWILASHGGHGAIREFADAVLGAHGRNESSRRD
ncbi:MAG: acylneuraminate cytidylyltransferase [Actinomycetota bacterium]